jgi:hypothetical protein
LYFFPATKTVWVDGADRKRVRLGKTDMIDCSDVLSGIPLISIAGIFRQTRLREPTLRHVTF